MDTTQYILAHDLGTSGNKATLYDTKGRLCDFVLCEYPTFYPEDRFVEQNPEDWWDAVVRSTRDLMQKARIAPAQVLCVSFSAQMMGCLPVGRDGRALRNMLIWADTRAAKQEKEMIEAIGLECGYRITGHRLSASYSAAKLLWLRDNEPEVYKNTHKMLHAKDYIVLRLTGKWATDYSDASGTNLMDIEKKQWSGEILKALNIPEAMLPELHCSSDVIGGVTTEAAAITGLLEGTPVVLGGGDGSCACVGAGVVSPGNAYNVVGSSSWISLASEKPLFDSAMRTFNWVHLDENLYTPCGTMQAAGYSYSWFRDTLGAEEVKEAKELGTSAYTLLNALAERSPVGAGGLIYLPYLLGERSPRWNHNARGSFIGLKVSTTKADMTRAVLEGVGYNLKIILDILRSQESIPKLTMIGGGAKGETWLRILSDIWQIPLEVPQYMEEATSMGAAVCAGVGIGLYPDYRVIQKMNPAVRTVSPNADNAKPYARMFNLFNQSYEALAPVFDTLSQLGKEE